MPTNELPLNHDTVNDLFTLPSESHQKGTYAELATIALVGDLLGEPSVQKWYAQVRSTYSALFPRLPDRTRYLQIQLNLETIYADLALRLPHLDDETVYVVDSTPTVCCVGGRYKRPRAMTTAASGRSGHGGYGQKGFFYGFKLHAVIDNHGAVARAMLDASEARWVLGD